MTEIWITPQLHLRDGGGYFFEGDGVGLLKLLKYDLPAGAPASWSYFRHFSREFVTRLCHAQEVEDSELSKLFDALRPTVGELSTYVMEAPPMTGGEYLSGELLLLLQLELEKAVQADYETFKGGFSKYVRSLSPAWKNVGKVSFHLAENTSDQTGKFPFAFIATFIHRLSETDRPKHLPLGAALKTYLNNQTALNALLDPIETAAEESELLRGLLESRRIFQAVAWTPAEAYQFLKDIPIFEKANIIVRMTNLWAKLPQAKVSVAVDVLNTNMNARALLNFDPQVTIGGEKLTRKELNELLNSSGGLVRVKGQWVEAEPEKIAKLLAEWKTVESMASREGVSMVKGLRVLFGMDKLGDNVPSAETESVCQFLPSGELKKFLEDLCSVSSVTLPPLPGSLSETLRPYQFDGVKYLWRITRFGLGACLADDMGLGKTLQLLSLITLWKSQNELGSLPVLAVLPATLLSNWKQESQKFTPDLKVITLHPSAMTPEERSLFKEAPAEYLKGFDLAFITYGMVLRTPELANVEFPAVIADEAQAIKNPDSKQSRAVRNLKGVRRIALTGTPVENRLTDLWSIFDFINSGLLGTLDRFMLFLDAIRKDEAGVNYAPLRRLTRPFILRRLKSDKSIISDLPDKTELKVYCGLSKVQAALYKRSVDALAEALDTQSDGVKRRGLIFAFLMQFKQICNHPAQFNGSGDFKPEYSGKFQRLTELVEPIASRQEKLLVFTQFREMTEPLHEHLAKCFGRTGLILHGGTPVKQRARLVEEFQSEDGPPFFVLSIKAGGTGLNLTAASHVVHFDRWWNPAVENQASDRAYRIGQKRNVLIHKFICRGTLEERIDELISEKQELSDVILSEGAEKLLTSMSSQELVNFVKLDLKNVTM